MIEIKNIAVKYDDFVAVKNVSFTIKDGEFFTLLGPSGCGKTTTLRAIAGFEKTFEGEILVDGKNIAPLSPEERGIGFVFQNYALFPSMTVFNNIAFGLKVRHVKKKEITQRVNEIADLIGISEHLPKKISELSGGQQQRVAIARALILNPKILLMDEPLSNLDAKLRVSMRGEIKNLQKKLGIVAIYVTHDQEEAMAISDKIAVFNHGVIEQIGSPKEIYHKPETEFAAKFVGDINEVIDLPGFPGKSFIRSEKVHVKALDETPYEGADIVLEGDIESLEFLGAYTKLRVKCGDQIITSLDFEAEDFEVAQPVKVYMKKSNVITFPESGKGDESHG